MVIADQAGWHTTGKLSQCHRLEHEFRRGRRAVAVVWAARCGIMIGRVACRLRDPTTGAGPRLFIRDGGIADAIEAASHDVQRVLGGAEQHAA
jgi:hypothetical protein